MDYIYLPTNAIYIELAANVIIICVFAAVWRNVRRMMRKERALDEQLEVLQRAIDDGEELKRRVGCQLKKLDRTLHKLVPFVERVCHG